jgi:phosphoribosyl 1,2-cyclic phosphodiesterase
MDEEQNKMRVSFLGVRGSYPVPGKATLRYGGNTTCNVVEAGGHTIIVDAGTGIISLGIELVNRHLKTKEPICATLLFTHVHHDHTFGFMFFKPVYFQSTIISILGPKTFAGDIYQELRDLLVSPYHPVALDEMPMLATFGNLMGGEVLRFRPGAQNPQLMCSSTGADPDDLVVKVCANPNHTKLGVLHYRFEYRGRIYVFATDVEAREKGEPTLCEFASGAHLIAHDAQYTDEDYYRGNPPKKGWGHSTVKMAIKTAQLTGAEKLALIHHDPEREDDALDVIEKDAKKLFPGAFLAREGMVVEV